MDHKGKKERKGRKKKLIRVLLATAFFAASGKIFFGNFFFNSLSFSSLLGFRRIPAWCVTSAGITLLRLEMETTQRTEGMAAGALRIMYL